MVLQTDMKLEDMQKILRINILNMLKGRTSVKEEYLSILKRGNLQVENILNKSI